MQQSDRQMQKLGMHDAFYTSTEDFINQPYRFLCFNSSEVVQTEAGSFDGILFVCLFRCCILWYIFCKEN